MSMSLTKFLIIASAMQCPGASATKCATTSCAEVLDETSLMQMKTVVQHSDARATLSGYTPEEWLEFLMDVGGGYCSTSVDQMVECMKQDGHDADWKKADAKNFKIKELFKEVQKCAYDKGAQIGEDWGEYAPEVKSKAKEMDDVEAKQEAVQLKEENLAKQLRDLTDKVMALSSGKGEGVYSIRGQLNKKGRDEKEKLEKEMAGPTKEREELLKERDELSDLYDTVREEVDDIRKDMADKATEMIKSLLK